MKQYDSNSTKAVKRNENANISGLLNHISALIATVLIFGIGAFSGAFLGFWFAHIFNLI